MPDLPRDEHLAWAKTRALAYCDAGDIPNAWASMCSDLLNHPETNDHLGIQLGTMQLMTGFLQTPEEMRTFIEGFR